MFNSKYSNILTVILVIAIIAIVLLLIYFAYDIYRKYYSNKTAEEGFNSFQDQVNKLPNTNNNNTGNTLPNANGVFIEELNTLPNDNSALNNAGGNGNTAVKPKVDGFTSVGTIEISKINVKQPILEGVSEKKLDTAVCLQYGKLNEIGNAVVIGHNYRNGTFFSNLYKLSNGDKITITDYLGRKVTYTVYSIFEAAENDASFYQRDTSGLREITLSTCTDDSQNRTIILAKEG